METESSGLIDPPQLPQLLGWEPKQRMLSPIAVFGPLLVLVEALHLVFAGILR